MIKIIYIFLIICFLNKQIESISVLPSIDKSQFTDKPDTVFFISSDPKKNYFSSLNEKINLDHQVYVGDNYYPTLVFSNESYLVRSNDYQTLELAIVSNDGVEPVQLQKNLKSISVNVTGDVTYDDELNILIFFTESPGENQTLTIYDIGSDTIYYTNLSIICSSDLMLFYYDYLQKTYYAYGVDLTNLYTVYYVKINNISSYEVNHYAFGSEIEAQVDIEAFTPYNGNLIVALFDNGDSSLELYKYNPTNDSLYQIFDTIYNTDGNIVSVVGPNPRYLVNYNVVDGSLILIYDLETGKMENLTFTPSQLPKISNLMITSILPDIHLSNGVTLNFSFLFILILSLISVILI